MNKSLKLKENQYLDSTGIVHNKEKLSEVIENFKKYKTAIISQGIQITQNTEITFNPDYSSINGTIIASVLIGGIPTISSRAGITKLIPGVTGTGPSANKVTGVQISSTTTQSVFVSILVFYKEEE